MDENEKEYLFCEEWQRNQEILAEMDKEYIEAEELASIEEQINL